jgi:(R)-amidase
VRALIAQLDPQPGSPAGNTETVCDALAAHSVDLAVFPELFLCGYALNAANELAIPADDELMRQIRTAAHDTRTAVIFGFAERCAGGALANAAACIDRDGTLVGVYRKTHLFADERQAFTPGDALLIASLAGIRVGPLICFDMEFPEPARSLCREGTELLVTLAANMAPYGPDHGLAARARALDNRRAHLYVNRVGTEAGLRFAGGSRMIDAAGEVTASVGDSEGFLEVEVPDRGANDERVDYLHHLREELPVRGAVLHAREGGLAR